MTKIFSFNKIDAIHVGVDIIFQRWELKTMRNQMKEIIADSFMELAKKKDIDKITVKNLVDDCGISRQSFYYHFQDILDVIEWQSKRMEKEISEQCKNAGSLEEAVRIMVLAFADNFDLIERFQDSQKRKFIEQMVMDSLQDRMRKNIREVVTEHQIRISSSHAEAMFQFCTFGITGLILANCKNKTFQVDELVCQIVMILKRVIPRLDEN